MSLLSTFSLKLFAAPISRQVFPPCPGAGSLQYEYVAPNKLASSTAAREKSDIDHFLLHIGHYKLTELRSEHFRKLYVALRKEKNMINGSTAATARARLFTMRDGL